MPRVITTAGNLAGNLKNSLVKYRVYISGVLRQKKRMIDIRYHTPEPQLSGLPKQPYEICKQYYLDYRPEGK